MKTIINIVGYLLIVLGSSSLGFLAGWVGRVLVKETVPDPLPTIAEIQKRIGAKSDGKLGPETQVKWDRAIFNQFARPYFEEKQ